MAPQFAAALFQDALTTRAVGRVLVYRAVTATTMTLARREATAGAPHGTLVLAEEQTAGRGRRGRSFFSPPGENLYFTIVLRGSSESLRGLPLAVPLAVCRGIASEGVEARIKWPNDIWVAGRKTCGMLIDAEVAGPSAIAFPGIGINVNGDPTANPELRDTATSLARELGRPVTRELLLARICDELEGAMALPAKALAEAYREVSMILGRAVTVMGGGATFAALATGIEDDGGLRVRLDEGSERVLNAAEVSLRPRA